MKTVESMKTIKRTSVLTALAATLVTTGAFASITLQGENAVWRELSPGNYGFATVSDFSEVGANESLYMGNQGIGTSSLVVDGGSTAVSGTPAVGYSSGQSASISVSGSGSSYTANGWIQLGAGGGGTLTVSNGGYVESTSTTAIGLDNIASATVDGGTYIIGGNLEMNRSSGISGESTLLIANGGIVDASPTTSGQLQIKNGTGTVTIENGTLRVQSMRTYDGATAVINIGAGSQMIVDGYSDGMATFMSSVYSTGSTTINIWDGSSFVDYTTLTENVDYQATYNNNGAVILEAIPEPATLGLIGLFSGGLFAARRIFMI